MFVKMTYIDNVTEVLCTRAPTLNGPRLPRLKGLNSVFYVHANLDIAISDQGIYTGVPLIYGICEDDADVSVSGFIAEITAEEYLAIKEAEHLAMKPYPSWIGNLDNMMWQAPVNMPDTALPYIWDEATVSWVLPT